MPRRGAYIARKLCAELRRKRPEIHDAAPVGFIEWGEIVSARYVVREGTVRGAGLYVATGGWVVRAQSGAARRTKAAAIQIARSRGDRVVRLLTPDEAKRKFAAAQLREAAVEIQACAMRPGGASDISVDFRRFYNDGCQDTARWLTARADALWPRKGALSPKQIDDALATGALNAKALAARMGKSEREIKVADEAVAAHHRARKEAGRG